MAAGAGARGHRVGLRGRARRARQARHGRAGARGRRWRAGQASWRQGAAGRRGASEAHGVGARGPRPRRAWARLVHWLGQFGAHASSLGFDLGF